jgi:hypothetical protein
MGETNTPRTQASKPGGRAWLVITLLLATLLGSLVATGVPARPGAQQQPGENGEIVVKSATGHVVWCVTRDAILVAAVGGGGEQSSLLPAVVAISTYRVGVLLGAVDWSQGLTPKPERLDAELAQVVANATRRPTQTVKGDDGPSDIEQIGVGTLELIRPLVNQIHHKLDLAPNEPLVELLFADYAENYGPEIWSLQYRVKQQLLGTDYWDTQVLRPGYYQLYPPEKGQPHTFVESQYPAGLAPLGLAARLARHDPDLERVLDASPVVSQAIAAVLGGQSEKSAFAPVADFLRTALPVVAGAQAKMVLAKVDATTGFQWLLPPEEPPPPPAQTKPSEPGAPSLRKYVPPVN